MFQLYKKRDFSAYLTDTIDFFKVYWKNFFANYIVITGALLLTLCVIFYFIFKDVFGALFGQTSSVDFTTYFQDNLFSFIFLVTIGVVITILFSVACMAYPIVYLHLVEKTGKRNFTSGELFEALKKQIGRVLIFALLSIFILYPLLIVTAVISTLAIFLVVVIFLIIMLIPTFTTWVIQSLYVSLNEKTGYFTALGRGWRILFTKNRFWHIIGATFVIYIMMNIIQSIFTMIPYFIMLFSMINTGNMAASDSSQMGMLMTALYILSIISSYFLGNFLMITQGMIYYSSIEQKEHTQAFSEIDNIGQNAE